MIGHVAILAAGVGQRDESLQDVIERFLPFEHFHGIHVNTLESWSASTPAAAHQGIRRLNANRAHRVFKQLQQRSGGFRMRLLRNAGAGQLSDFFMRI